MHKNRKLSWVFVTLLIVGIALLALFFAKSNSNKDIKSVEPKQDSKTPAIKFKYGNTAKCRAVPSFIRTLKMKMPSLDSRQNDGSMGLQIRDYSKENKVWQHPSWKLSGYIGAFERDHIGNVFVSPLPYVSLQKNPPETQNQLYIVDAKTAEMTLFITLPSSNKPDAKNPFGIMGLFFDCDTKSLYVSSVAGSTPRKQHGVIFQIDVKTKKIIAKFENTDAVGLGVFNTAKGKRLYFGSARDSSLYSIALDGQGHFTGDKRYELSLSQLADGDTTIIKKIKFKKRPNSYSMSLQDMEFGYRLMAENRAFKKKYNFEFNQGENKWDFKGVSKY